MTGGRGDDQNFVARIFIAFTVCFRDLQSSHVRKSGTKSHPRASITSLKSRVRQMQIGFCMILRMERKGGEEERKIKDKTTASHKIVSTPLLSKPQLSMIIILSLQQRSHSHSKCGQVACSMATFRHQAKHSF